MEKIDKVLILNAIKSHLGIEKDSEFAKFLGISPQGLAIWCKRNTFDIDILYAKCNNINPEHLITGKE